LVYFRLLLGLLIAGGFWLNAELFSQLNAASTMSAHDFSFESIDGEPLPLAQYAGKVVLIVNTASECGFAPQLEELQSLWEHYEARGLVVLGVPSNDFGGQEPGSAVEIQNYCRVNYGVNFTLTAKTHIKGTDAHPFYLWAQNRLGFLSKPRWNFHKYLIARDGSLNDWFSTLTKPKSRKVIRSIERLLAKPK